ncbi:SpoIID/LytB domain-containing protein [Georgenia sp. M64]|uniref:SpoIID/LytB domain-containing protein n=1 Tax=Georgenia sp. M64 TaxID=3120520 RepID=UPI0030DDF3A4
MRAPLARLVLALLVAAATLLPAPTAGAATERYPVPASGEWAVDGRGWGHGRGMSQWGAKGAAEAGLTHAQILDFYYPGTTLSALGSFPGTTANPTIGVGLTSLGLLRTTTVTLWTPAGQGSVRVEVVGGAGVTLGAGRLTVTRSGDDFTVVHAATGARHTLTGAAVRVSTADGVVVARSSTTGTWYRGSVRLADVSSGDDAFDVVNDVPLEEYLRGVVPQEMPASWSAQAVRAQAVAARSYMLAEGRRTARYDTCDTTACQVYGGRATVDTDGRVITPREHALSDDAIRVTAGQVRTYGSAVALTQFSSTNGGWSVAGGASTPYLVSRADPYTGTAAGDTRTVWSTTLSATTAARYCPSGQTLSALLVTGRDGNGALGGRITGLSVECSGGVHAVPRASWSLGMLSPWWRPQDPPHTFYLSTTFSSTADIVFDAGYGDDAALVGDWDGDGTDTVALRRGSTFLVRNSNDAGPPDVTFTYGRADDVVLVGDWDGDGVDTLAVRRGGEYHVKNSVTSGVADVVVRYGRADDEVHVGDWDGDGVDTLTVRREAVYYVKNSLEGGPADVEVRYGRPDDVVLTGDWDGDGDDTLAVRRANVYYLANALEGGAADVVVSYGRATDTVLVGDWDADGDDTLGVHRRP